jgi:hypothetical protein
MPENKGDLAHQVAQQQIASRVSAKAQKDVRRTIKGKPLSRKTVTGKPVKTRQMAQRQKRIRKYGRPQKFYGFRRTAGKKAAADYILKKSAKKSLLSTALKTGGKLASRWLPGVGATMLVKDVYDIGKAAAGAIEGARHGAKHQLAAKRFISRKQLEMEARERRKNRGAK